MNSFEENLKYIKVIDKNQVMVLKKYIYSKYKDNSKVENAKLLSNTVNHIIYSKLEGLPNEFKQSIKVDTLKNTFMQNKDLITIFDMFNSCLKNKNLLNNFTENLKAWINSYSNIKINSEEFYNYLSTRNITLDNTAASSIVNETTTFTKYKKHIYITAVSILLITSLCAFNKFSPNTFSEIGYESRGILGIDNIRTSSKFPNLHLPVYMRYRSINKTKLKNFLDKRNSLLASEPYFSTIINTSKEFNLNPVLLFAITGQEQNFVPKTDPTASKIANNPFNVYHSWQEYNTNIKDSSQIASRTVINLAKGMPKNSNPFLWIGRQYAEDKNWGNGIESIFNELSSYIK